jgi:retron-type reverse transcriptase
LYLIFLDITKAYDTLDRDRMLQLLQAYGVGPNICLIIDNIWNNDTLILKQHQYYSQAMQTSRGVRQGDIMSPTLFNIMVDAVVREYENQAQIDDKTILQFYADDAVIAAVDHTVAQYTLDVLTTNFKKFGLHVNVNKTESMTILGTKPIHRISEYAYTRKITRVGLTNEEKKSRQTAHIVDWRFRQVH